MTIKSLFIRFCRRVKSVFLFIYQGPSNDALVRDTDSYWCTATDDDDDDVVTIEFREKQS